MGCTYFIGGQEFTEKEFKKHLASELDTYVKKGLVDLTKIKITTNEKNKGSNVREIQKGQGNAQNEGKQQNGKNDGQETNVQEEKVVQGEVTPPITAQETSETATTKTITNEPSKTSAESKKGGGSKDVSPSTPKSKAKKIIGKAQKNLTNVQEALQKELYTPYELAIKYFLEGGKISVSGLQKIFGNKRGKSIEGEKRARISLLSKGESNSESIGEYIYGEYTKKNNGQGELYDDSDFRSAVEEVLNDFTSVSQMANHINDLYKSKQERDKNDFDPNQPQFTYEAEHIFDVLDENEINELLEGANSKELANQIAEQWLDSEEGKQEMSVKLKAEQETHNKSIELAKTEIEKAKQVYSKAQSKYEKLKAELGKNAKQDQKDIFGKAPSESALLKNDLAEQERIVDNARKEAKDAEKILNEKEAELERKKDNAPNAKKIEFKDAVTKAGEAIIKILDPREGIRGEGEQKAGIGGGVRSLVEGAVKVIHKAIDAGAELKDAIKEGVKYVKGKKASKNVISAIEEKLNNVVEEKSQEEEQEQAAPEKVALSEELQKIKDGFINFIKSKTSGLSEAEMQKSIDGLFDKFSNREEFLQELKDNNISLEEFKKGVEENIITQPKTKEQQNAINNTEGQVQEGNQPSGSQEYQGTQNVSETPTAETNRGDSGVGGKEKEVAPSGIEPVGEAGKKLNVQPLSGISKAEIKKQHGKVLKFESQTAQEKAEKANDLLNSRAESNGRDADQEAKAHVEELQQKEKDIDFKSSEYDILTTARHKLTLEAEIAELEASGDKDGAEAKRQELDKTLDLLLKLGSKSGANLGLFAMVMGKMDDGGLIALMPSYAKIYNVSEMPKSIAEMEQMAKDGKLSPNEIAKIRPFVEQIDALRTAMEKYKTDTVKIEAEVDKKAVEDYIKGQVDKAETEAKITTVGKGKGAISKASARRRAYIEKIRKGEVLVGLKPIEGARTQGYNFNTAEVVARALELIDSGLNKIEAIRQTLKSVGAEGNKEIEDEINYHITRSTLPDKAEVLQDLKAIANAEKSATITPEMVNKGLINDIINDNIYTDATYDKVIDNSLKDIQEVLPNATKQELIDALLRKGDFKQKTKTEAENEYKEKEQAVKRLANKVLQEKALSDASTINALGQEIKNIGESNLSPAEKKAEIAKKKAELEAKKSEVEKDLDKRIKKYEDAIKEEKKAIAEKEALKKQEQKRYDNLVKELDRVRNRREREEAEKKKPIPRSQREIDLINQIKSEKEKWAEEKKAERQQASADKKEETKNKKLKELEDQLRYVREEKQVFDKGIKDPKKTDEQLQKLRDEIKQAGYDVGVREEMQGKQEIKTAKDYENAIQEAKNSDMDEDVKAKTIADLEAERDELLNNTKQGVLVNLKTSLDGYAKEISNRIVDAIDAKDAVKQKFLESVQLKLQQLSTLTNPSVKNLSDSINQAGQALDAIINDVKDKEIKKELEDLRDEFHANYDKTSTELQRAKLMELAKNQLREAKRRLEAKQYTEVPKSKLDIERDEKLMKAQLEVKAEWQKLNSLKIKAEQGKETIGDKILATRTKLLISSASALEKVGISAITKPIIDTTLKQTFGRLTTKLTGIEPVKFRDIGKAYRGVYLSKEGAKKLMDKATNDYVKAIDNYEAAKKDFGENSKEAQKAKSKLLDAEFDVDAMFPYVFINTNVLTDAKEILLNGATKLDEELGLGRKSYRKERNTIQNIGFFLDGVNRTHSIMKTPSSKIAMMEGYMENLRYYQKMEGKISIENRIAAWNLASIGKNAEMKVGRFAESTYLSDAIQKLKSNESRIVRYPAKFIFPVSKIAINITKQGVDMAMPLESIYKLAKASVKGAELRELEGGKYTFGKDLKRGIESLNLEEKKYINTLLYRGAFGLAQYAAMYFLLSDDKIKYGGAYNSFDPFGQKLGRVKGADGKELKAGEWEFFGHKAPKAVEIFINHSPYSLPMSLAANAHEQATREGRTYNQKKAVNKNRPANILLGTTNEIVSRLPVSTVVDIMMAMTGDEYKLEKTSSSLIPSIPLIPKEYFMEKNLNNERVKRETYDPSYYKRVLNQYKASQPFLEKTLPKKR